MAASVLFTSLILPHLTQLTPYQAGKPLEELERELGLTDAIKLASNENPLGPSPLALAAILDTLGSLHRYPDSHAYYLKEDLARHHGLTPAQLILGNGSDEVLDLLVRALVPPGGEVLSTTHTFLMYGLLTQAVGGVFRPVPLKEMRVDLSAMAQAVTPQTRLIIVNNPNNPTGTAFKRQEWEDFLAAVPATATVVLDEAYIDFADDPQVPSCLEYLAEDRPLVGLRTFSKTYGLAGLRIGYGFGPSGLMDYLNRLRMPFNVNSLAQAGARAALHDVDFLARTRELVLEGKDLLYRELARLGLTFVPSQANFVLIRVPRSGKEVYQAMLREGVIIRAMDAYGFPDYIRVNVGLPEENRRFLEALQKVLGPDN
ncbi:MAG: histidinol-phosphate transaminase [Deltaproteobacteria bacterium CG07_land_8_20_14_0_80_60_11]|nr:MAG: histidinol-phosphate transaminase [Deltaproteobacteria bacterium CG07_land_8_20_14_0_80_60_11]